MIGNRICMLFYSCIAYFCFTKNHCYRIKLHDAKRKYNRIENGHIQVYQFPFQIFHFRFVSVFRNFFVNVFVSINRIKIFPLTDISVNVNHTG